MAQPCTRTALTEGCDALRDARAAAREITNWMAHLDAFLADPTTAQALQAQRAAVIVQELITSAVIRTDAAVARSILEVTSTACGD